MSNIIKQRSEEEKPLQNIAARKETFPNIAERMEDHSKTAQWGMVTFQNNALRKGDHSKTAQLEKGDNSKHKKELKTIPNNTLRLETIPNNSVL